MIVLDIILINRTAEKVWTFVENSEAFIMWFGKPVRNSSSARS